MPGLGSTYLNTVKGLRLPVYILTPGGWWSPDEMAYNERGWHGNGWTVAGSFPQVSITPSINFPGRFHSWVTNGMLLDDVEGRVFPDHQPAT